MTLTISRGIEQAVKSRFRSLRRRIRQRATDARHTAFVQDLGR